MIVEAQSLSPYSFAVATQDVHNGNYALTYTIGASMTGVNISNTGYSFVSGDMAAAVYSGRITVGIISLTDTKIKVNIFPNPASEFVNIQISDCTPNEFIIQLFDVQGRTVRLPYTSNPSDTGVDIQMNVQSLNYGVYNIRLIAKDNSNRVADFKIVKLDN